jgi:hypothetical protein
MAATIFTMMSRQQVRRAASLVLAIALLVWAEDGVAMLSAAGVAMQCRAHMSHTHQSAATVMHHPMASGHCHGHANANRSCASHPDMLLLPASRPDCCAVGDRPSRPVAFLIASGRSLAIDLGFKVFVGTDLLASPRLSGLWTAESAPFTRDVLEKKTDLRI